MYAVEIIICIGTVYHTYYIVPTQYFMNCALVPGLHAIQQQTSADDEPYKLLYIGTRHNYYNKFASDWFTFYTGSFIKYI